MFGIIFCLRFPVLQIQWDGTSISECTKAPGEMNSASMMRLLQIKPSRQDADTVLNADRDNIISLLDSQVQATHHRGIWAPFKNYGALAKTKCILDVIQLINGNQKLSNSEAPPGCIWCQFIHLIYLLSSWRQKAAAKHFWRGGCCSVEILYSSCDAAVGALNARGAS